MMKSADPVLSAQVLLQPASGKMPAAAEITAANIEKLKPSVESAALVRRLFEKAGFEVGPLVGLGLSITAKRSTFDRYFGSEGLSGEPGDLPLDRLPADLRAAVAAISFSAPPDYGPGSFS